MKQAILDIINHRAPIKSVDLVLAVMNRVNPQRFNTEKFHSSLKDLISSNQIIELEYINEDMDYRIKSVFFKGGTKIMKEKHEAISD